MSKYNRPTPKAPGNNAAWTPNARTFEGGAGYLRTPREELFFTAVTEMAEDKYYETAEQRQFRLTNLVKAVVNEPGGWEFVCDMVQWLRHEAGMRSASIMIAAEAVVNKPLSANFPTSRSLVNSAIRRADEPAEFLGYWLANHGRQLPAAVKRGVADAAVRLYNERNLLKYDGQGKAIRFGDVIELTHPSPKDEAQSALFRYAIDSRHNRDEFNLDLLPTVRLDRRLIAMSSEDRIAAFQRGATVDAGWSWERTASWIPGGLDAGTWETLIPTMGYMALLRNLRNFDQAGISKESIQFVLDKLTDADEVARSLQFPYRFYTAFKNTESLTWASALESALQMSTSNVPVFPGRTLVLIDTSGSMQSPVGGYGDPRRAYGRASGETTQCYEAAALFGAVLAARNPGNVNLAVYADYSAPLSFTKGASVLKCVEKVRRELGKVGYGTRIWESIRKEYNNHDRVVVLTDMQAHDQGTNPGTFLHFVDLSGYKVATAPKDRRTFHYGGFTDKMFTLMPLLERGASAQWPWEK